MNESSEELANPEEPAGVSLGTGECAFSFAGFRLEPDGTLLRCGTIVHLPPKELAALRLLLAHAGQIVSISQMRKALWAEIHVSADSVTKCISSLRARLKLEDCIQTVYKRGYRFSARVVPEAAGSGRPPLRIAISPFTTGPGVAQHLGPAVSEETAAQLIHDQQHMISVLAQDSVFSLARRGLNAHEIGVALKADFVLTGRMRALPSHIRMVADLIRVRDGVQVWTEDMLVDRSVPAGLEKELASRLNFRLGVAIPASLPPLEARVPSITAEVDPVIQITHRVQAYEILQKARHEWRGLQSHRTWEGLDHLQRAIDLDPALTAARVELANLCVAQAVYGYMAPGQAAATARRAAEPITDFSGRNAEILPALGWISFHYDRDLAAALKSFTLSAHLPHDPWITRARSFFALSRHRFAQAEDLLREAIGLDPFSPWLQSRLAWTLHLGGKAEESFRQARYAVEQFPEDAVACFYASIILACNREAKRATALAQDLQARLPHFGPALAAHAYALARDGRPSEARSVLEQMEWRARERFVITGFNAAVYLELGAPDEALKVLEASMQQRCPWFFQLLADPRLAPLQEYPEFRQMHALLTRMEAEAANALESE